MTTCCHIINGIIVRNEKGLGEKMNMTFIPAKTIITKNKNNKDLWFGIDYSMNIYRGCCHGCIYCDSRSDCYQIKDFDTVRAKENAIEIIRKELKGKINKGIIGTGSMSDPYNFFEKEYRLTRQALEVINYYGFGLSITTKSNLITRDIDLLKRISCHSPVIITITVTTCSNEVSKIIEPNVSVSSERFDAIKKLTDNGIYTGVLFTPVLPFIEDNEENIRGITNKAYVCGAKFVYTQMGVTLRQNQRDWYFQKLDKYFEGLKEKYISHYGNQYICKAQNDSELCKIFLSECHKLQLHYKMEDIIKDYKRNYTTEQISLL